MDHPHFPLLSSPVFSQSQDPPAQAMGQHVQQSKTDIGISLGALTSTLPAPHLPPTGSPYANRGAAWPAASSRHWHRSRSTGHSCWPTCLRLAIKRAQHCWTRCLSEVHHVQPWPLAIPKHLEAGNQTTQIHTYFQVLCQDVRCARPLFVPPYTPLPNSRQLQKLDPSLCEYSPCHVYGNISPLPCPTQAAPTTRAGHQDAAG